MYLDEMSELELLEAGLDGWNRHKGRLHVALFDLHRVIPDGEPMDLVDIYKLQEA